jgi:hypothetical protein
VNFQKDLNNLSMNDQEFKKTILDKFSSSFCAAKWYNATIWLGSGQTTSCHHPPAHAIDVTELKTNPSALHNTPTKKLDRAMMQAGQRVAAQRQEAARRAGVFAVTPGGAAIGSSAYQMVPGVD